MKIAIFSFDQIYATPYINKYLEIAKHENINVDVHYWDRLCVDNLIEKENIKFIPYKVSVKNSNKINKLKNYILMIKKFSKVIKSQKYDKLIFLQTHAAVFLYDKIKKYNYLGKYIVDIRDYTLEKYKFYKKIEKKTIFNSYKTIISSPGYKEFLPEYDYVVAHNITFLDNNKFSKKNSNVINISFIGVIRFYEIAKKILLKFKNDNRFLISFIGSGADKLKSFCQDNDIQNIKLIDRFDPSETIKYYEECSIINNYYGNSNPYLDYALSNKLYYGIQLNIPILVSENTYSSNVVISNNLGFSMDLDDLNCCDSLYETYINFDFQQMKNNSNKLMEKIKKDNEYYEMIIKKFFKNN